MEKVDWSKIHSCPKSEGKIIAIIVDECGVSRCSYCNMVVDYASVLKKAIGSRMDKF